MIKHKFKKNYTPQQMSMRNNIILSIFAILILTIFAPGNFVHATTTTPSVPESNPTTLTILTASNQVLTTTNNFVVAGTIGLRPGTPLTSVTGQVDNGPISNAYNTAGSRPAFATWSLDVMALTNGKHVIYIYVVDSLGYKISKNISVTVNYTPPPPFHVTILSPANGATITDTPTVTLTGTTVGPIVFMSWHIDKIIAPNPIVTTTFSNWKFTTPILSRGAHTIYVVGKTNCCPTTAQVGITNMYGGINPPSVTILSPANGAKITTSTVTVSGTAGSAMVSTLRWHVDSGPINEMPVILKTVSGSVPWSFTTGTLAAGSHVIYVQVIGPSGTGSAQISITK